MEFSDGFRFFIAPMIGIGCLFISLPSESQDSCIPPKDFKGSDLRNDFGPIRDQDKIGWCYAYAGADLVGHWLYKKGLVDTRQADQQLSAHAMALDYNEKDRQKKYQKILARNSQGDAESLDEAQARLKITKPQLQTLRDEILSRSPKLLAFEKKQKALSNQSDNSNGYNKALEDELDRVTEQLENGLDEADPRFKGLRLSIMKDESQTRLSKVAQGGITADIANIEQSKGFCLEHDIKSQALQNETSSAGNSPELTKGEKSIINYEMHPNSQNLCEAVGDSARYLRLSAQDIKKTLQEQSKVDAMTRLVAQACHRFPMPPVDQFQTKSPDMSTAAQKHIAFQDADQVMANGEPVAISFDSRILHKSLEKFDPQEEAGHHAVLLVGKKWNCKTNEADYIVRNSWGSGACQTDRNLYQTNPKAGISEADFLNGGEACVLKCSNNAKSADSYNGCENTCYGQYYQERSKIYPAPFTCEQGYYVMSESALKKVTSGITYLVPSGKGI